MTAPALGAIGEDLHMEQEFERFLLVFQFSSWHQPSALASPDPYLKYMEGTLYCNLSTCFTHSSILRAAFQRLRPS